MVPAFPPSVVAALYQVLVPFCVFLVCSLFDAGNRDVATLL